MISMDLLSIHKIIQVRTSIKAIIQTGKVVVDRTTDWKVVIEFLPGNDATEVLSRT
jgi:hypothetical protein